MGLNILGKGKVDLSHNIKYIGITNSKIISCQVKSLCLFAKVLDNKEVAVFGDYDIFICYKKENVLNGYETRTKREVFCEVVPYEKLIDNNHYEIEDIEATARYINDLECEYTMRRQNLSSEHLSISVTADIEVALCIKDSPKNNIEFIDKSEIKEVKPVEENEKEGKYLTFKKVEQSITNNNQVIIEKKEIDENNKIILISDNIEEE